MDARVVAIVVNKDGAAYLRGCLSSLLAQTYTDLQVVLVDNASRDDSVELVRREFPVVHIIQSTSNLGFCAANNLAVRSTSSELVATLNNDTWVEPGWLESLVRTLESNATLGSVASLMVFADRLDVVNSAGICIDRAGIAWDRLGGAPVPQALDEGNREVFGACAGAALYRRTVLDQVGGFDDSFFAYLDDVDLAWRLRLAGFGCRLVTDTRVRHVHSATGVEGSPLKSYLRGRNKLRTIIKDYPAPQILFNLPLILIYDLAAVTYALLWLRDLPALRGRLSVLRDLPVLLGQRRQIQSQRRAPFAALSAQMSSLETPWRVYGRFAHVVRRAQART